MATIIDSSFLEGSYLPQDTLNNIVNKVKIEIGDQIIEIDESLNSDSSNPVQNKTIFEKFQELEEVINNGSGTGTNITIDTALSDTSENPVQNKVINSALENKQDVITGGATTITNSNLTTSRALISDTNGKVAVSAVTSTELGYLDGVTSAIQTQINNKASKDVATTSTNGLMSSTDKTKLDGIETGANNIIVDTALNSTSTNPVQNKVINSALDNKAVKSHASTSTTFGIGTANNYGHLKLSDSTSTTSGASGGIAATPTAVKTAYDKAVSAYNLADSSYTTANETALALDDKVGYNDYQAGFDFLSSISELSPLVFEFGESLDFNEYSSITKEGVDIATIDDVTNKANIIKNPNSTTGDTVKNIFLTSDPLSNGGTITGTGLVYGTNNTFRGYGIVSGSNNNIPSGYGGIIIGGNNTAKGSTIALFGTGHTGKQYQAKFGRYSTEGVEGYLSGTTGDAFIIGNGTSSAASNAFRVTYGGAVYGTSAFNSTGADYAETWEWLDGNPDNEDRVGKFVAFEGTKIRLATANDLKEILGIVSAFPAVVGDNYADNWQGMYLKDKYGRYLTEHKFYEAEYDEEGNITREAYETDEYVLNPDYDPTQEYIPRLERPEFDAVGTHGKLVVIDDGTCEVGGFCLPFYNGIATKTDYGFYVMERIDDTTIKVYIR